MAKLFFTSKHSVAGTKIRQSMKISIWQKIGLSFLIIGFLSLFIIVRAYDAQSKPGPMFTLFVLYVFEWATFGCLGLIVIILRQLRVIKEKRHFIYIFIGASNLANVFFGSYLLTKGFTQPGLLHYWILIYATACLAFLIFVDVLL
jgi:hypothetical protein